MYTPQCWWVEVFDSFRKVGLTALAVFVLEGTASQLILGMLMCMASIAVYSESKPFRLSENTHFAVLFQWAFLLTFFAGLIEMLDIPQEEDYDGESLGIVLTALNVVAPVGGFVYFMYIRKVKKDRENRTMITTKSRGKVQAVFAARAFGSAGNERHINDFIIDDGESGSGERGEDSAEIGSTASEDARVVNAPPRYDEVAEDNTSVGGGGTDETTNNGHHADWLTSAHGVNMAMVPRRLVRQEIANATAIRFEARVAQARKEAAASKKAEEEMRKEDDVQYGHLC
jgi:hypothetical protein